jgi:hypothetical protein
MTDLAGANRTYVFVVAGATADPNAPYLNSTGAATLTLYEFNSAGVVTEAAGALQDGGGVLSLALPGTGQFVFAGANAFTGAVTLAGSTLASVRASGALGSGAISFLSRSTAKLESQAANFASGQAVTIQAGAAATLEAAAGDTLTLTGAFDDEAGAGATLHVGSATDTGTVVLAASAVSQDASGALSLDGALKLGSAASASLVSALAGGVTINGTLDLDGQNLALQNFSGAGAITDTGAAATLTLALAAHSITITGAISGSLALDVKSLIGQLASVVLTGADSFTSGVTVEANASLTLSHVPTGDIVDNGVLVLQPAATARFANALTGAGQFELTSGAVTFTGDASQFTGGLVVDKAKLTLSSAGAFAKATSVGVTDYATLEATTSLTLDDQIYLQSAQTLEATAGATLTIASLNAADDVLHIGSATDTGTVAILNWAALSNNLYTRSIEIDGGTLALFAGDLPSVVFEGTTGKLALDNEQVAASSAAGSVGEVDLSSSATSVYVGAAVNFTGGGETVKFVSGANRAGLIDTGGLWDTVEGSSGLVMLDDALASVVGGGDQVHLDDAASVASLYNTGVNWDSVSGVGNVYLTNAQTSVNGANLSVHFVGSGDAASVYYTGTGWDAVYGSNGVVDLTAANVSIVGGADAVHMVGTSGNAASLYHTNFAWDVVYGSGGLILLTDAQASVVGGGNTLDFDGEASDFVSLYSTGGTADTVNAVNGGIILNGAQANIVGHDDAIIMLGGGSATQTLTGSNTHNTYYYQQALGLSTIAGFTARDAMVLSQADFGSVANLFANDMAQVNNDTVITLDANNKITLTGVQKASLSQAQFSLV